MQTNASKCKRMQTHAEKSNQIHAKYKIKRAANKNANKKTKEQMQTNKTKVSKKNKCKQTK